MAFWKTLKKWHQVALMLSFIGTFLYGIITTFRAGILYPFKQDMRFQSIESSHAMLSNKVDEISYKQDRMYELMIRVEERLWPRRSTVADRSNQRNDNRP
jgi:hypothetical protein